jgi:hypothetical protein
MTTGSEAARLFREMADRIERSAPEEFGGAFLVVPPTGDAVDGTTVTSRPNATHFWHILSGRLDVALAAFKESLAPTGRRGF